MFIECLFSGRHCPEHFLFRSSKIPYDVGIIIITLVSQRGNWRIRNIEVTWLLRASRARVWLRLSQNLEHKFLPTGQHQHPRVSFRSCAVCCTDLGVLLCFYSEMSDYCSFLYIYQLPAVHEAKYYRLSVCVRNLHLIC